MDCSICLDRIKGNDKKILSCNHIFHTECYIKCVQSNNYNSFIKCPLCREINMNTSFPFSDPYKNLKLLHKKQRCIGKTKNGTRCKCKSSLFSRYCHNHEKVIINKEHYLLTQEYIEWLFMSQTKINTKISMIHLFKYLLEKIKQKNKQVRLTDIHYYYFRFHMWAKDNSMFTAMGTAMIETFCEYFNIEEIDNDWINECKEHKTVFF